MIFESAINQSTIIQVISKKISNFSIISYFSFFTLQYFLQCTRLDNRCIILQTKHMIYNLMMMQLWKPGTMRSLWHFYWLLKSTV